MPLWRWSSTTCKSLLKTNHTTSPPYPLIKIQQSFLSTSPKSDHFLKQGNLYTTKLTPQLVLSTLQNTPCDLLSLTFFLWCARQPHYFHDRYAFFHMANVLARLVQQSNSSIKALLSQLQTIVGREITIKPQTLLLLLRIFWHGGMSDLVLQLYEEMPNYGYIPNTYTRNILIDVLFRIGRVDAALQVLRDTHCPNFLTFSIAVCNLCKLGDLVNIRDVLRTMLRKGYYLNARTFSSAVHCFCKSGRMATTLQLVSLMISLGIPPSVNTWSIIIDGFCKYGNVVMADFLLEKMLESSCSPNVVTYTSLIKGLLKSQMPERALCILSTMESKGCAPDLVLCNILIDSLSKLGRYEDALDIYFSLPKRNLVPDSYTFCSLISVVCLSRQFDLLPLLISGICIQVDLVVSNSLLSYFCKAGYPSGAVDFYNDMIIRGFVPDGYSYAGLLMGLCGAGRVHEAVNVYNAIVGNGFCIDPHIHTIVFSGLLSSGKLHTAIKLFRRAAQEKYPLDVVSYTAAIQGLVQGGAIQEACVLFRQMKEDSVAPNAYIYHLMLSGFCRVRDIKMVKEILNEIIDEGIVLNDHVFYMVNNLLCRSCGTPSSLSLFNEMCHSDSVPDKALGTLLLKGLKECVNLGGNLVTVQNVDSSGSDEMSDVAVAVS